MLALSDASIKNIMCILDGVDDVKSLLNLRRSSFRLNQLATQNNLHKLKSSPLTLSLNQNTSLGLDKLELSAYIGIHIEDYITKKLNSLTSEMGLEDIDLLVHAQQDMILELTNKHISSRTNFIFEQNLADINVLARKAFIEARQKIRSINVLTLYGFRLNTGFLHMLKQLRFQIRGATTIKIDCCYIKWTENRFSQFLALFDNLREVHISGKFHRAIVTDKHLSLATLKKITISNTSNSMHFPGITSKSCENWLKNGIEKISFSNISTELSYSAIKKLTEDLKTSAPTIQKSSTSPLNFGGMKLSKNEYRQIILAQTNRNEQWQIKKRIGVGHDYKVSSNNNVYYQFRSLPI